MGHLPPWHLNANLSKPEKDIQTELCNSTKLKKTSIVKVQLVQDKLAFTLFFLKIIWALSNNIIRTYYYYLKHSLFPLSLSDLLPRYQSPEQLQFHPETFGFDQEKQNDETWNMSCVCVCACDQWFVLPSRVKICVSRLHSQQMSTTRDTPEVWVQSVCVNLQACRRSHWYTWVCTSLCSRALAQCSCRNFDLCSCVCCCVFYVSRKRENQVGLPRRRKTVKRWSDE